jgi:hypothetical protein
MTNPPATLCDPRPHRLLPADAIVRLQQAAQTENTPADPLARTKAIERATAWVRRTYPNLFK